MIDIDLISEKIGKKTDKLVKITGSRNSEIYCITTDNNKKYGIKVYPDISMDSFDRYSIEKNVYKFLNYNKISSIPEMVSYDNEQRFLLYEWVDGVRPKLFLKSDLRHCIGFLKNLDMLKNRPGAKNLSKASDCCLTLSDVENKIKERYLRLIEKGDNPGGSLVTYLELEFLPIFEQIKVSSNNIDSMCKNHFMTLSPSDFGLHNMIIDNRKSICFLDFEYFGWDSAVKLVCDFIIHPENRFSDGQRNFFINEAIDLYSKGDREIFIAKLNSFYPMLGMLWCMIMLNEYLPKVVDKRKKATIKFDLKSEREKQLNKSRVLLNKISDDVIKGVSFV